MIDLHTLVHDPDDDAGTAERSCPGTLDPEPFECGTEAALSGRVKHHGDSWRSGEQ
jgi:hypothetical protein